MAERTADDSRHCSSDQNQIPSKMKERITSFPFSVPRFFRRFVFKPWL